MSLSRTEKVFVVAVVVGSFLSACTQPNNNEMIRIGPDVQADMVIYYKADVTEDQINYFLENVIGRPDPRGRGHDFRDGITSSLRVSTEGHVGTAITLSGKLTQAEREEIRKEILSSPIVYKVLENVAPADVKKLN
jgi:hypothetical protein